MSQNLKEIIKKARGVSLGREEKLLGRERLRAFMRGLAAGEAIPSTSWFGRVLKPTLAAVAAAMLVGGGVSFASENSLPGDVLYPVKIRFNEEVRALLTTSVEGRADWETTRAERRLEEAEKLAVSGELNEQTEAEVGSNFQKHAEKAKNHVAELEAKAELKTAAKAGARLEGSLKAHDKILKRLRNAKSVAATVKAEVAIASTTRVMIEKKISAEDNFRAEEFKRAQKEHRDDEEEKILNKARRELKVDFDDVIDSH